MGKGAFTGEGRKLMGTDSQSQARWTAQRDA
jgi:hypothetical protein